MVACLLATAALWVRIQTSLKNIKWETTAKEWPTHKKINKKIDLKEANDNNKTRKNSKSTKRRCKNEEKTDQK